MFELGKLDTYPKHNIRDNIAFFFSYLISRNFYFIFSPGINCQQIQKKILFEEGIWQK